MSKLVRFLAAQAAVMGSFVLPMLIGLGCQAAQAQNYRYGPLTYSFQPYQPSGACEPNRNFVLQHAVLVSANGNENWGTGVLLSGNWALTAYHIVENTRSVQISSFVIGMQPVWVEAVDAGRDLALLRLSQPVRFQRGYGQVHVAEKAPLPGQSVYLHSIRQGDMWREGEAQGAGRPGVLSSLIMKNGWSRVIDDGNFQKISLVGLLGDSGGGLYNCEGELLGLINSVSPASASLPLAERDALLKTYSPPYLWRLDPQGETRFRWLRQKLVNSASTPESIRAFLCNSQGGRHLVDSCP